VVGWLGFWCHDIKTIEAVAKALDRHQPVLKGAEMAKEETFEWAEAFKVASGIRQRLEPHCEKLMIVGSLRRQCPMVHDIDIALLPLPGVSVSLFFSLTMWLRDTLGEGWQYGKGKSKLINGRFAGIPVDLYFATPDTWWTLVVIRTGSRIHNIHLCSRAKAMGMKLHADGSGVEAYPSENAEVNGIQTHGNSDIGPTLYVPTSEENLFYKLGLNYVEPKDRR
jgi:DNA polymerase/3'-5' exonuclease PolX